MEENKKQSLFYRVVNSKTSVILYILTFAIFYFGSMIGGLFVANQMMPFNEIIALCGELIEQNLGIFVIYVIFAIIAFFSVLPVIGIFVSFLPCLIVSIAMWIIYIIYVAIKGNSKEDL
ncbi:MAG: hypothetical protein IJW20_00575 [Clostridia bacterium]|nr:hypothetical protein [Clostridia bacterium]